MAGGGITVGKRGRRRELEFLPLDPWERWDFDEVGVVESSPLLTSQTRERPVWISGWSQTP